MLVKAGSGLANVSGETATSSAGVSQNVAAETLLCTLDNEEMLEKIFATHGKDIAAVIIEPLPANSGLLPQREEYLNFLRNITKKYNSLLIFDEVISGFRVAFGGMSEKTGIIPDLVTYGKVIGGGFPVGALGGKRELMDHLAPVGNVYQAGTLSANPISMTAGLATLKKLKRDNIISKLNDRSDQFVNRLKNEIFNLDLPWDVTNVGSLFWLHPKEKSEITKISDIKSDLMGLFKPVFTKLLNSGVYLAPNPYEISFISLAHTDAILEESHNLFIKALKR
jgi:glutamate-1-semialdehyde 2,1-aminomutase